MRTLQNHIKGLAIAGLVAAMLVNASPAFAGNLTITNANGSKACIILAGVDGWVPDWVATILGAVQARLGCEGI